MDTKLIDLCYIKRNFLSKDECQSLIDLYDEKEKKIGGKSEFSTDVFDGEYKNSSFKTIIIDPEDKHFTFIKNKMSQAILKYGEYLESINLYNLAILPHYQFPHSLRILKYEKGSEIHPHSDHVWTNYGSLVLNLNDDYEGGEFSFFNKQFVPELKAGDLMIFPADIFWSHEVTKVTNGVRYSVNSFIKNMPDEVFKIIHKSAMSLTTEYLQKYKDKSLGPLLPQFFTRSPVKE